MNQADREDRIRLIMKRRVNVIKREYGMSWGERDLPELVQRLVDCIGEVGVDDVDLRTAVRLFNREVIGRDKRKGRT